MRCIGLGCRRRNPGDRLYGWHWNWHAPNLLLIKGGQRARRCAGEAVRKKNPRLAEMRNY